MNWRYCSEVLEWDLVHDFPRPRQDKNDLREQFIRQEDIVDEEYHSR